MNQNTRSDSGSSSPSSDLLERRGIFLRVDYQRISPDDSTGMVDVTCEGDESWIYADIGYHHGAQCASAASEKRAMELGAKLAKVMREHFGEVRPILDEPVTRKVRSNDSDQRTGRADDR